MPATRSIGGDGMAGAARVGDSMSGSVGHHAGHILYWVYTQSGSYPVYCSGHSVQGGQQEGSDKVICEGRPAARQGDYGYSNCQCDGQGYNISQGSSKVFIQGKPAARIGDSVNIHSHGSGSLTSGSSKIIIGG